MVLAAIMVTMVGAAGALGQAGGSREYELKAAFLYNFVKFVDWPSQALPEDSPTITVGILGKDPFGNALETINGKTVKGKRLVVRHLASVRDATNVQVLFISDSERERLRSILDTLRNANILTVGEMDGFVQSGGMINLTHQSNKIRFEINPDAAERARLRISSQLLKLAKVVRT